MGLCTVIDLCLLCLEFIVYSTDYIISIVLGQGLFNLFIFLLSDWKAYKITPPLDSVNHLCKPYLSAGQYLPSSDQENPQESRVFIPINLFVWHYRGHMASILHISTIT